jgi:hypothetical protein
MPMTDAFYSAVAAVASTLIGFLGGFFVMRLQAFAEEWRNLKFQLDRVGREHDDIARARARLEQEPPHSKSRVELNRLAGASQLAHEKYAPLLIQKARARMPLEIPIQFALLLILTVVGVWRPLWLLSGPTQTERVWIIAPVVGLIFILWSAMFVIALRALQLLKQAD